MVCWVSGWTSFKTVSLDLSTNQRGDQVSSCGVQEPVTVTVVVLDTGGDLDDMKPVIKTQSGFKLLHDAIGFSLNVERNMKIWNGNK